MFALYFFIILLKRMCLCILSVFPVDIFVFSCYLFKNLIMHAVMHIESWRFFCSHLIIFGTTNYSSIHFYVLLHCHLKNSTIKSAKYHKVCVYLASTIQVDWQTLSAIVLLSIVLKGKWSATYMYVPMHRRSLFGNILL